MAKERKKKFDTKSVKINQEPLAITKIGEITTSEQNPIFVLLFFVILIAFVLGLPYLVTLIKGDNSKPDYSLPSTNSNSEQQKKEEQVINYYDFKSDLSIYLENDINLHHFKLDDQILTFTISNNRNKRFDFREHNYFLEIYSENKTLLERVLLLKSSVPAGESISFSYNVSASSAQRIKTIAFVEKDVSDYPNVTLKKDENKKESLVCIKNEDTITYQFNEQKLQSIEEAIHYTSDVVSYDSIKNDWKNKADSYNQINGSSSTFIDVGTGFYVNTSLDLANVDVSKLNNVYYYSYETLAKVIDFEMKAQGFSCK